jgi:hypothetical protein
VDSGPPPRRAGVAHGPVGKADALKNVVAFPPLLHAAFEDLPWLDNDLSHKALWGPSRRVTNHWSGVCVYLASGSRGGAEWCSCF